MKKKWLLVIKILAASTYLLAQESPSGKILAEKFYAKQQYAYAIPYFEELVKFKQASPILIEKLATCYRKTNHYEQASNAYAKIIHANNVSKEVGLHYAQMLKCEGRYEEAKKAFLSYQEKMGAHPLLADAIKGCDEALNWKAQDSKIVVENFASLNTANADWGANWYTKDSILFFSDFPHLRNYHLKGPVKSHRFINGRTNERFTRPFIIDTTLENGLGSYNDFPLSLQGNPFHLGPMVFTQHKDTAYVAATDLSSKGIKRSGLFMVNKDSNGLWSQPLAFAYNQPSKYGIIHAALSRDGSCLYFASDMPGGFGGYDIWFSNKMADGSWGTPINCGAQINTPTDEAFPTMNENGLLYFSSKGHIGMGGFDIFEVTGMGNHWSSPINLKSPINSSADDFYYSSLNGKSGFFSSNRKGGKGSDDIYIFK